MDRNSPICSDEATRRPTSVEANLSPAPVTMLYSYRFWTGAAEPALTLARDLASAGHEVELALDGRRPGNIRERAERLGLARIEGMSCSTHALPWQSLWDVLILRRRLLDREPSIVHSHMTHDHWLAVAALRGRKMAGHRLIRSIHLARSIEDSAWRRRLMRTCDGLIVGVQAHREILVRHHGIDPARVALVHGAVDGARFSPGADGPEFRRRHQVPIDAPLVLMLARFQPHRQHRTLIEAFSRVRHAFPTALLALAGRGEHEAELRAAASRLVEPNSVRFVGYVPSDQLPSAYRAADVAVWLAPGSDATCRGMLEALACERPMVLGHDGAMADALAAAECGIGVDWRSPESIATAIAALLGDPARRRACGRAGRELVLSRHTAEARLEAVERFYERVLELPTTRGGRR
ncbi:MAG: glycosyltransferase family 4 protein [Myxococcales bacterium]|nr:glycosyltransferase family 4 protein [Myxococcales bacterium]